MIITASKMEIKLLNMVMGKKKHVKAKLIIVGGTFGSTSIPLINQWSNAKTFESIC